MVKRGPRNQAKLIKYSISIFAIGPFNIRICRVSEFNKAGNNNVIKRQLKTELFSIKFDRWHVSFE